MEVRASDLVERRAASMLAVADIVILPGPHSLIVWFRPKRPQRYDCGSAASRQYPWPGTTDGVLAVPYWPTDVRCGSADGYSISEARAACLAELKAQGLLGPPDTDLRVSTWCGLTVRRPERRRPLYPVFSEASWLIGMVQWREC